MAASSTPAFVAKARQLATQLSPTQKIAIGVAAVAVVAGGFFLTRAGGAAAQMSPLYTDLDPADAASVTDALAGRSVDYELTDAGHTVLVPADQVYDLRVAMAGEGLPASNDGYALLDKQGITTSEFRQRVDYQRAMEGELARTIESIDGVQSATVHLALGEDSVFVDEVTKPTASVLIRTKGSTTLPGDAVNAVTRLVASSVKDLDPAAVTVADGSGRVLAADGEGPTAGGDARAQAESAYEQDLSTELTNLVAPVVGPGKVAITVNASLDLDKEQATAETHTVPAGAATGVVTGESTSTEVFQGTQADAEAGVLGPDGAPVADTGDDANSYEKADADRTYAVDRTVAQTTKVPGQVNLMNVSVMLDEGTVTAEQAAQIETAVAAAAGIDAARGDQLVVTRLPFDTSAADAADAAAAAQAAADKKAAQEALFRTGGIAALVVLALALAYRSARRARRVVSTPIELGTAVALDAGATGELAAGTPALEAADGERALPAGEPDASRVLADEVSNVAEHRPEDVAQVLRAWLAESGPSR